MDVKLHSPQGDGIYMFFETKNPATSQGDIAAAVSKDAGATWQQLGVVLDEEWHLSYPYVFSYNSKANIPLAAAYFICNQQVHVVIILTCASLLAYWLHRSI